MVLDPPSALSGGVPERHYVQLTMPDSLRHSNLPKVRCDSKDIADKVGASLVVRLYYNRINKPVLLVPP